MLRSSQEKGTVARDDVAPAPPVSVPAEATSPVAFAGPLAPDSVLDLQRRVGNRLVGRALQRQSDAGVAPAAGVTAPPGPAPEPPKPTFSFAKTSAPGARFDSEYVPVGPVPAAGQLNITHWVHIKFQNFTRAMMRQPDFRAHRWTREQMRDFAWTDSEKETFETGFMASVRSGWSGKHSLHLNDSDFAEYRCSVNVEVVSVGDPSLAHTKITAQKVPRGAPRFRSFVSGDEATLDIRDPSEPETSKVLQRAVVAQIGPFDRDSSELTPTLLTQVQGVVDQLRPLQSATDTDGLLGKDWAVTFLGRSSSPGSAEHNKTLGLTRAQAVAARVGTDLGRPSAATNVSSVGERNASEDAAFQRVDVSARKAVDGVPQPVDATQNVAAHEAGHMFGLGDEYVDEAPGEGTLPKFFGDKPEHHGDVEALVGSDAANELAVQDSGSMMSRGGDVKRGHYVYFVQALNQLTGKTWKVE